MLRDKILKLNSQLCYKVAFIGSKEVGKTTLASYLNGQLKSLGLSVDIVPEVARYCPLPLNEKTTIESAYWLLGAQISAEALVEKTRQFVICDRTVLDVFPFIKCSHEHKEDAFSPTTLHSLKT
jgi:GTPase SAR1 family protein